MARASTHEARCRVCAGLHGNVVEIGFGTGLNARYYPPGVTKVWAIEPSQLCMRLAQPRIARVPVPVEHAGSGGEQLAFASGEFDVVLSTWTLCTIPDLGAALGEMRRVLKPGGMRHSAPWGAMSRPAPAARPSAAPPSPTTPCSPSPSTCAARS